MYFLEIMFFKNDEQDFTYAEPQSYVTCEEVDFFTKLNANEIIYKIILF